VPDDKERPPRMSTAWSSMAESPRPLVALVGAVTAAIPPAVQALTLEFPEARAWNVIDDRLIAEAIAAGGLTGGLRSRMARLIRYALDGGADGVLLTCSMYGPVAHDVAASVTVPVLAADDAAFEAVVASGFSRIALVSSRPVPLADALARFGAFVEARQGGPEFVGVLAEGAYDASVVGDTDALARALAAAVPGTGVDGILLAQYSLAPASERLAALTRVPGMTGPGLSARA
jgi:hypothetical protein